MKPGKEFYEPSGLSKWLITRMFRENAKLGDFVEIYNDFIERKGLFRARLWFWCYIFTSFPSLIKKSLYASVTMLKNYLKIAF